MQNVDLRKLSMGLALGAAIAVPALLPANAEARPQSHRQKSKNQWRNLAIAGGAAGVLGLVSHNKVLTYGGLAGGAYSAYRYEQDRKSQRRDQDRYRRFHRYSSSRYHRTRHGYASSWRHDNGLHRGWSKH